MAQHPQRPPLSSCARSTNGPATEAASKVWVMGGIVQHSGNGDGQMGGKGGGKALYSHANCLGAREGYVFVAEPPPRSSSQPSSGHNSASVIAGLPAPPRLI